jgi:hypothetical protein
MGTRADFWKGSRAEPVYIGSIAWDGYPSGVFGAKQMQSTFTDAEDWLAKVEAYVGKRDDGSLVSRGNKYPFPWADGPVLTDYHYVYEDGVVYASEYATDSGKYWIPLDRHHSIHTEDGLTGAEMGQMGFKMLALPSQEGRKPGEPLDIGKNGILVFGVSGGNDNGL